MSYNNRHIKGWLRIILFIITYMFVGLVFYFVGVFISGSEFQTSIDQKTEFQRLIISLLDFLGILTVLWLFLKIIDLEPFDTIGLRLKNRTKDILSGLALGLIIMGFGLLFLLSINEVEYKNINFDFMSLISTLLLYTIVSFKEEILFRGYFLKNLIYSFNKPIALIISAFIFSIFHGLNPSFDFFAFINLFLAGIMLGLPYLFNRNLWLPIALHFSWNFFQSLFGFNVSGMDSYSLIQFSFSEENIINGGSFGFEGSILSIIVQVIVIIGLYVWYRRGTNQKPQLSPQY